MLDRIQTSFANKSFASILLGVAIMCGIFLNSVHHDSFIGYHPENIKVCATQLASLPCSPAGWSFLLAVGMFFVFKIIWRQIQTQEMILSHPFSSFGANNIYYLQLFDPVHRCLRRGIICRLVYE